MICPNCNQSPSAFLRFSFSLQGVSLGQSVKGYFRCQHCSTLLRVGSYGSKFWIFFVGAIVVLAAFIVLWQKFFVAWGPNAIGAIWVTIVVLIAAVIIWGTWKYAEAAKVEEENHSPASPV